MATMLINATTALPGTGAASAPSTQAGSAATASRQNDAYVIELLQQMITIVNQLVAIAAAQQGAQSVQGGGGLQAGEQIVDPETLRSTVAGSVIGGQDANDSSWGHVVPSSSGAVSGGGPAAASPGSPLELLGNASIGGSFDVGFTIYGPSGAAAAPAPAPAPAAAATGGGSTAKVDMRRVLGTPQPGGIISQLIARATPVAAPARSEGTWIVLADAAGAKMQVHVHGPLAATPDRISDALARGQLVAHLHEDGTVHLHDVA